MHVPGHPDEAERQIRAAAAADGLVYIRLSTAASAVPLEDVPGRLSVLRTGSRGTVLVIGPLADAAVTGALRDIPHRVPGLGVGHRNCAGTGPPASIRRPTAWTPGHCARQWPGS